MTAIAINGKDQVALILSKDEAVMLRDVLANVGGNPKTTRRGLAENVFNALGNAGIKGRIDNDDDDFIGDDGRDYKGDIVFLEAL